MFFPIYLIECRLMSIEAYENNLVQRFEELKSGDQAYKAHTDLVLEAIIYASQLHGDSEKQRVLDCGCGLGFMTAEISQYFEVVGIDPSEKSINLAQKEHKEVKFYSTSAEKFPERMSELKIPLFDQAVLNMVLHSVDDQTVLNILTGVKKCLRPEGTIIIVVPTKDWLVDKLVNYAMDQGMQKKQGIDWILQIMEKKEIDLPVKIRGGEYYPIPLSIFNRELKDYEDILKRTGFGFKWETYDSQTKKLLHSENLTYLDMNDYFMSEVLFQRNRVLLMSFSLPV